MGKVPCKLAHFATDILSQQAALPYAFSARTATDIHDLAGIPITSETRCVSFYINTYTNVPTSHQIKIRKHEIQKADVTFRNKIAQLHPVIKEHHYFSYHGNLQLHGED